MTTFWYQTTIRYIFEYDVYAYIYCILRASLAMASDWLMTLILNSFATAFDLALILNIALESYFPQV